jgi:hypothetical protein
MLRVRWFYLKNLDLDIIAFFILLDNLIFDFLIFKELRGHCKMSKER